ncbi:SCO6745 family protein [Streptacidiphilus anmyonensis]|uniref:SCO6745 family protein n=1 Tax=Streptacidiphilus anmyonensis TaxID=405782 RepID=UPI0005A63B8E|nr:hypothetical protein [Streptacidiphilus anmyonensis]
MTTLSPGAGRQCLSALNSLHSIVYFAPDLDEELADRGIADPMACYLAGRAAALGPVGPGTVSATFYGFKHEMIATHVPLVWRLADPQLVVAARFRAADAALRRYLGEETCASPELAEAARLALRAVEACERPGRPLFAAHADLARPEEPHLALWYAATLLREYRGDGHIAALQHAGLGGLDALVSHSASREGMPKHLVMSKRGWTEEDWAAAEDRLRARGLMDAAGELTEAGVRLREDLEEETDRLDRAPYEHLGADGVARLTQLCEGYVLSAVMAGAFPAELLAVFANR